MTYARIFRSGNSQAVRLPKEFRFDTDEVEIFRRGEEVVLRPKVSKIAHIMEILNGFSDDFLSEGRTDEPPQEREAL